MVGVAGLDGRGVAVLEEGEVAVLISSCIAPGCRRRFSRRSRGFVVVPFGPVIPPTGPRFSICL